MKACFIIPYFGHFPNTFELWLDDCKNNPDFNWLIFTDDESSYNYPKNVFVHYTTLQQLKERFEQTLGFQISLNAPYKLCDYKPLYGDLFKQELINYSHWGYCDVDLLFGDLKLAFSEERLIQYDKISVLGHMCLLKNKKEINTIYKNCNYTAIFQDNSNKTFDEIRYEPNINSLLTEAGYKVHPIEEYADIGEEHFSFQLWSYIGKPKNIVSYKEPVIFLHKNNNLYKVTIDRKSNKLQYEEISYVHFQKRKIKISDKIEENYLLVPNRIEPIKEITIEDVRKYSKDKIIYFIKHRSLRIKRWLKRHIK